MKLIDNLPKSLYQIENKVINFKHISYIEYDDTIFIFYIRERGYTFDIKYFEVFMKAYIDYLKFFETK